MAGDTPLHRALKAGRLEARQFLLNRGADIDVENDYNDTALNFVPVAENGHAQFTRIPLERGAMIDARYFGRTPLRWAAQNGRTEVVRLLLERGADVRVRDESGFTPFRDSSWDHKITRYSSRTAV